MGKKLFNLFIILSFVFINICLFQLVYEDNIKDLFFDDYNTTDYGLIEENDIYKLEDSKIDGQTLTFENDLFIYYSMLNNKEKKLYIRLFISPDIISIIFILLVILQLNKISYLNA